AGNAIGCGESENAARWIQCGKLPRREPGLHETGFRFVAEMPIAIVMLVGPEPVAELRPYSRRGIRWHRAHHLHRKACRERIACRCVDVWFESLAEAPIVVLVGRESGNDIGRVTVSPLMPDNCRC